MRKDELFSRKYRIRLFTRLKSVRIEMRFIKRLRYDNCVLWIRAFHISDKIIGLSLSAFEIVDKWDFCVSFRYDALDVLTRLSNLFPYKCVRLAVWRCRYLFCRFAHIGYAVNVSYLNAYLWSVGIKLDIGKSSVSYYKGSLVNFRSIQIDFFHKTSILYLARTNFNYWSIKSHISLRNSKYFI